METSTIFLILAFAVAVVGFTSLISAKKETLFTELCTLLYFALYLVHCFIDIWATPTKAVIVINSVAICIVLSLTYTTILKLKLTLK